MQSSLRIARVDVGGYRLPSDDFAGLDSLHRDLQAAIRRHLPGVTASVLALPAPSVDGKTVDWYSDLSGQPIALTSLPAARRAIVKAKLEDRLASLRRLADELPARVRGSDALAQALRSATRYPGDSHVYAVGDEPVLTLWGFTPLEGHRHGGAIGVASRTGAGGGRGHRAWGWASALVLILTLAGGGWYWLDQRQGQSLREALERVIARDCAEPDLLAALAARLDRLEAQGGDYAGIRQRLCAEQRRCTLAATLAKEVDGAGWDCARLAALRQGMADQDPAREPLAGIGARLDERLGVCAEAADSIARLGQILGDCAALAGLDRELGVPPVRMQPLGQARERIDRELALCAAADELGKALSTNLAQCEGLHKIDGRLAAFDASRPPLAPIRARLDAELALCDKAATYRQALVDAQMDCARLRALDERMAGEDTSRGPLQSIRRQLDAALEQCKALEKIEQSLRDAVGDCAALAALAERMQGLYPQNPILVPVKRRIAEETRGCDVAHRLGAELAAATGDCAAIQGLALKLAAQPTSYARLGSIRTRLAEEQALCEAASSWRRRIQAAGGDCAKVQALAAEFDRDGATATRLKGARADLDAAVERCNRTAVADARRETEEQARAERKQGCPGTRTLEEAPQLAMVFDASGSMKLEMGGDSRGALQALTGNPLLAFAAGALGGRLPIGKPSGPSRMQLAKQAGARIVRELPADADVALVKIEDCPRATNGGFYPPSQRGQLLDRIEAMAPRDGTPLASAIAQAADMLDGVKRPGLIVVISDGKDTCGGDPCGVAQGIAARKPKLRVNAIDIMGDGAGRCLAAATVVF